MAGISATQGSLWKRALTRPDKVLKAVHMVATKGMRHTQAVIKGQLEMGMVAGYAACGKVIGVGQGIDDISIGDYAACAGAQFAHHAEIISVPRNLTTVVPENVTRQSACTVTLGAIALQGVRRLQPTIGETFCVIGLGIIGQITAQILSSNGCRVIGVDTDKVRVEKAVTLGADFGISGSDPDVEAKVARLTDGLGVDGVVVCASGTSSDILKTAFSLCRRKARVILVGDVGMNLDRQDIYAKELDFLISTSYGPGRYDRTYEEDGLDYPLAYVRWTENRNMSAYLGLLANGDIDVTALIEATFDVDDAEAAYASLSDASHRPLAVLLQYPQSEESPKRKVDVANFIKPTKSSIGVALIGAGAYAKGTLLPIIAAHRDLMHLQVVASRTAHNAKQTANLAGARYACTDYNEVLSDPDVDLVVIATRHHLHTELALQGLQAGKNVFVEKPLAINDGQLAALREYFSLESSRHGPLLIPGFNRRFSSIASALKDVTKKRTEPLIMNYQMNAGYIPATHWVHGPEGGGRNIGEACHIYDLFIYLTGSSPASISVEGSSPKGGHYLGSDNFVASIRFQDGSIGTLTYTSFGTTAYPKESMSVFCEGSVYQMSDYRTLDVFGENGGLSFPSHDGPEKGHKEEFSRLMDVLSGKRADWPVPVDDFLTATQISLDVEKKLPGNALT